MFEDRSSRLPPSHHGHHSEQVIALNIPAAMVVANFWAITVTPLRDLRRNGQRSCRQWRLRDRHIEGLKDLRRQLSMPEVIEILDTPEEEFLDFDVDEAKEVPDTPGYELEIIVIPDLPEPDVPSYIPGPFDSEESHISRRSRYCKTVLVDNQKGIEEVICTISLIDHQGSIE
ncbi:hypothetical protein V2J09_004285 [Rumex salicifolius]